MSGWNEVGQALVGSWPSQVSMWGRDGIAAYLAELEARGVTFEAALVAIRSCGAEQKFPPSAPELAALARRDPSRPTFEEAYRLIYGAGGVLNAPVRYTGGPIIDRDAKKEDAMRARMADIHPLVASFIERFGLGRLQALEIDHDVYGEANRKQLREAWDRHVEAIEGREIAAIASGRRDGLRGFDPLQAIKRGAEQIKRAELGAGS